MKELKVRAQVKSRWYYVFWGAATIAVVAGQIYVGNGFRSMAGAVHRVLDSVYVERECLLDRGQYY
tara:strand:+ start:903 stop:1100 length:198 start_codon:yes stop_codon:yes gene_type:complete